jgi:hypothetical protein
MRCDRAVTLLATGGLLGRWRARRHVARCSRCAAEAARIQQIARELSATEPLTAAQRALWSSASTEHRPSMSWSVRYRPALLGGSRCLRPGGRRRTPARAGTPSGAGVVDRHHQSGGPHDPRRPVEDLAGDDPRAGRPQGAIAGTVARRSTAPPACRASRRAAGCRGALAPRGPVRRAEGFSGAAGDARVGGWFVSHGPG